MLGRRLDRHVVRSFLSPLIASIVGLAVLIVIFDLFERLDECLRLLGSEELSFWSALGTIGIFYLGRVLNFLVSYGGLACLTSAALTVASLHRNSEITAIRAAGISIRRTFLPLLVMAMLIGIAQVVIAEVALTRVAPLASEAHNIIYRRQTQQSTIVLTRRGRITIWKIINGQKVQHWTGKADIQFTALDSSRSGRSTGKLSLDISPHQNQPGGLPRRYRITALSAIWDQGSWKLKNGRFFDHSLDPGIIPCSEISCLVSPYALEAETLGLAGLKSDELYKLRNFPAPRIEIWRRTSLPLMNVILLLVGLPLAVLGSNRGGRLLPLGLALVLGAFYILVTEIGSQAASGRQLLRPLQLLGGEWLVAAAGGPGRLSVDLPMALPHLIFLLLGLYLYWRSDR
jgi:lipopolysaccharide export LptBFGC system permease protein LptF